ncbi:hypothetical protein [Bradyrhizobium sp. WSM471]|uniref:hypothetical protein n=1 Tax=Bradyrhizobium sp. WSM471 TaxID=319017 RepID=UPI0012FC1194|nr:MULTISPECIES: hypothetical protein [Bradyrhizobium]UFW42959.1 hypothetical protein BcanWSM471_07390 [Bradyrhizobium canariense]
MPDLTSSSQGGREITPLHGTSAALSVTSFAALFSNSLRGFTPANMPSIDEAQNSRGSLGVD